MDGSGDMGTNEMQPPVGTAYPPQQQPQANGDDAAQRTVLVLFADSRFYISEVITDHKFKLSATSATSTQR